MALRDTPPFRADHVGSLLRPKELLAARERDDPNLPELENAAIRDVVQLQQDVGLRSATDGEFRRASWHMDFIYSLDGVTKAPGDLVVKFHNAEGDIQFTPAAMHIDGRLGVSETIFGDAFRYLQSCVSDGQVPKLTIPSPSMVHYRGGRASIDEAVYPDMDEFWADLVGAYREEVRRLGELGCTYLQLDDTSLAYVNDPKQRAHIAEIGGDPEHQHEAYIANINRAIADRPCSVTVTTHMCRGNNQSMWAASSARKSPTWPSSAAPTCSSTRCRSPSSAIQPTWRSRRSAARTQTS
jgi:5-methyltetrahydropteroyltriglutamate--homocysteine methyltransferase